MVTCSVSYSKKRAWCSQHLQRSSLTHSFLHSQLLSSPAVSGTFQGAGNVSVRKPEEISALKELLSRGWETIVPWVRMKQSHGDWDHWGQVCVCFFKLSTCKRTLNKEVFEQRSEGSVVEDVVILRKGSLDSEKTSKCKDPPGKALSACLGTSRKASRAGDELGEFQESQLMSNSAGLFTLGEEGSRVGSGESRRMIHLTALVFNLAAQWISGEALQDHKGQVSAPTLN